MFTTTPTRAKRTKFDKVKHTKSWIDTLTLKKLTFLTVTFISILTVILIFFTAGHQPSTPSQPVQHQNPIFPQQQQQEQQKQEQEQEQEQEQQQQQQEQQKQGQDKPFKQAVRYRPALDFAEYESLKIINDLVDKYNFPPPSTTPAAEPFKLTPFVAPEEKKSVSKVCINKNGDPWVNYVVEAPDVDYLLQHLLRFLHYLEVDKIRSRMCNIRVFVLLTPQANRNDTTNLCNEWSATSGIPVDYITSEEKENVKRLSDAIREVSKSYPNDIIYIADVTEIVPPGFTGLVQDNTILGKTIFVPSMREFKNPSKTDFNIENAMWTTPNENTLYNVGVFARDAVDMRMYLDEESTPIVAARTGEYSIVSASIPGLLKPFTRLSTNEKEARKNRMIDEAAKNPRWVFN